MKTPPECIRFGSIPLSELSREILAGNNAAFEEFYRRYAPRVYGLLMVLSNANDQLSRDLLQIVMLRVARKFSPATSDETLWAWLATIARNAFVDHLRSEQRRLKREQSNHLSSLERSEPPEPSGPSEKLTTALDQAIAELDSEDQTLVREFYFNNQCQASIASHNETTVKALQSRLARIRRRLKQIITQKLEDET